MATSLRECICQVLPSISDDSFVFNPSWVKKDGIKYHKNNCYVVTGSDGTDPVFSRIIDVFIVCGDMVLLYVQAYSNQYYDEHFHAYVVCESPHLLSVLTTFRVQLFYTVINGGCDIYITLKHSLLYII